MTRRWRAAAKVAAVGALALLLTGCLKLDMKLDLKSDNTVGGSIVFAVDKQVLELTGQSADALLGSAAPLPSDAPGVTSKPYDDGKFVGQEYTFDSVPLNEFAGDPSNPDSLSIVREGDEFKVSGVLDLSQGISGATGFSGINMNDLFSSAQISISITFPGAVKSSNGTESGNTVTWTPKFGERLELQAVGSAVASSSSSSSLLMWILIGAGVVLVLVILFVLLSRRGKGAGAQPAAVGFEPSEAPAVPPATPAAETPTEAPAEAPPAAPEPAAEAPTEATTEAPAAPEEAPTEAPTLAPPAAPEPAAEAPTEAPSAPEAGGDVPPPPPPASGS